MRKGFSDMPAIFFLFSAAMWSVAAVEAGEAARVAERTPSQERSIPRGKSQLDRSWNRYREVAELNIFSRKRQPRRTVTSSRRDRETEAERARSTRLAEAARGVVLFGVSKIGDRLFAFFEDTRDNTITHATVGDTIEGRKLTTIDLDSVQYEVGGKTITIAVDSTLTGERPPERTSPAPSSPDEAASKSKTTGDAESGTESESGKDTTEPGEKPAADGESALERLLRRRREEAAR